MPAEEEVTAGSRLDTENLFPCVTEERKGGVGGTSQHHARRSGYDSAGVPQKEGGSKAALQATYRSAQRGLTQPQLFRRGGHALAPHNGLHVAQRPQIADRRKGIERSYVRHS